MAYIEEDILTKLKADSGVAAIVGTNVFPFRIPQKTQLPAVSFISTEKLYSSTLRAPTVLVESTFVFNCTTTERIKVLDLSAAVRSCMNGSTDHWDSCILDKEEQGFEFSKDADIMFYHCVLTFKINYRV